MLRSNTFLFILQNLFSETLQQQNVIQNMNFHFALALEFHLSIVLEGYSITCTAVAEWHLHRDTETKLRRSRGNIGQPHDVP